MSQDHYMIKCIVRVVTYIEHALQNDEVPKLEDIAQASNLSKYHFHRLYRLVTGETCHQTVTRLRVARGVASLSNPNTSVTEASMIAGFSSSQAFAKAMKRVTSETATSLRNDPDCLAVTMEKLGQTTLAGESVALTIGLASLDPFEIVATRTVGIYPELHQAYGELFELAGDPSRVQAILGRPHGDIDGPEPDGFTFECGLKLIEMPGEFPEGYSAEHVFAGHYLLARNIGSYDGLPSVVDALYHYVLANKDVHICNEPLLFHYLDDPESIAEAELRTDIYLKVQIFH